MAWNKPGNGDSGNRDPWGPRRGGQQGPPDLDEIVRKIQARLNNRITSYNVCYTKLLRASSSR